MSAVNGGARCADFLGVLACSSLVNSSVQRTLIDGLNIFNEKHCALTNGLHYFSLWPVDVIKIGSSSGEC